MLGAHENTVVPCETTVLIWWPGALSNIAWKPLRHNKTKKISNRVTPSVTPNLTVVARFDS